MSERSPQGFASLLGIEVLVAKPGEGHVRAAVSDAHLNLHGSAHGGFLFSLADEAFAIASNSREAEAVALSARMDFFKAVRVGDVLEAKASEEHLGRSVATYRIQVTRDGEAVALFTGTVYRRARPA